MKRITNINDPNNVIIVSDAYINGDRIVCITEEDEFDLWRNYWKLEDLPEQPMMCSKDDYHWEGLKELLRDYQKTIDRQHNNMAYESVELYIDWIDSLPEQSVEGLEEKDFVEEVRQYYSNNCTWDALKQPMLSIITRCARHFAEWMKSKMLEDAVEGVAEELYNDGEPQCTVGVGTYFQPGEEVYVIEKEKYK